MRGSHVFPSSHPLGTDHYPYHSLPADGPSPWMTQPAGPTPEVGPQKSDPSGSEVKGEGRAHSNYPTEHQPGQPSSLPWNLENPAGSPARGPCLTDPRGAHGSPVAKCMRSHRGPLDNHVAHCIAQPKFPNEGAGHTGLPKRSPAIYRLAWGE